MPLYIEVDPSDETEANRRWIALSALFGLPMLGEFGQPISDGDRSSMIESVERAREAGAFKAPNVQFEILLVDDGALAEGTRKASLGR